MIINNCNIDNDLFELYCHSIKTIMRSPTLSADQYRREIHNRILRECGICRDDQDFENELDRIVYETISYKQTVRY